MTTKAGAFRIVKRSGDAYEVFFKNFNNDVMVLVAEAMPKPKAEILKEDLNAVLFGESPLSDRT